MTDKAFEALKSYDWGKDRNALMPIDDAAAKARDDASRKDLETKLVAALKSDISRDAKDYVCRKLMVVGGAACVPALAELVSNKELSHMARYALERIQAAEAATALRDALGKTAGPLKIGVLTSLGARQDEASIDAIAALIADSDAAISRAAALALGAIRTPAAAAALAKAKASSLAGASATVDATLACAEDLLKHGKNSDALAIYKSLVSESAPKHVQLAAKRGMVACLSKK